MLTLPLPLTLTLTIPSHLGLCEDVLQPAGRGHEAVGVLREHVELVLHRISAHEAAELELGCDEVRELDAELA